MGPGSTKVAMSIAKTTGYGLPKIFMHSTKLHFILRKLECGGTTSCAHIVGPIFFDTTVNSEVYLNVINQFNAVLEVDK